MKRATLVCLCLIVAWAPPMAAQDRPNDEPSSFGTLFDRSDLGNVAQSANMKFHAGVRELERARKLLAKASEEADGKRAKTEKKAAAAFERGASEDRMWKRRSRATRSIE